MTCRINPSSQCSYLVLPTHPESQSTSSSQLTSEKSKCFYFCTKLCNRLLLSRGSELLVPKSQVGHPPGRFPTCCSTPQHTLHTGHQHRHLSAPVICDPSDKVGWSHCLQPSVTFGCVCSSCCCGEHFPHQFRSKAAPTQTHEFYKSVSCVL